MKIDNTKKGRCLADIYNNPEPRRYEIAKRAADRVCMCKFCDGYLCPSTPCDKPELPCRHWRMALYGALVALEDLPLETLGRMQERKDNAKGKK